MTDHRSDARVTIEPDQQRWPAYGSERLLVQIVLTDNRSMVARDSRHWQRPDVACQLNPARARELADQLLALAEIAERHSR
jgi:hypothetical protein